MVFLNISTYKTRVCSQTVVHCMCRKYRQPTQNALRVIPSRRRVKARTMYRLRSALNQCVKTQSIEPLKAAMSKADGGTLHPWDYVFMRVRGAADDELHFRSMFEWVASTAGGESLVPLLAKEFGLPLHLNLVCPTPAEFVPTPVPTAAADAVEKLFQEMKEAKGPDGSEKEQLEYVEHRWPDVCSALDRLLCEDACVRVAGVWVKCICLICVCVYVYFHNKDIAVIDACKSETRVVLRMIENHERTISIQ